MIYGDFIAPVLIYHFQT